MEGTDTAHGEYVVSEWNYRGDIVPNYMIVQGGWKLLIPYSKSSRVINALYDLSNDPHEMHNLLGTNPEKELYRERAEELRSSLLEWLEKNNSKHYKGVSERELL
jgi:arylsulfatase A-like enzyme